MSTGRGRAALITGAGVLAAAAGLLYHVRRRMRASIRYPRTRKDDTVDEYHGVKITDPYRWLEDPDSGETKEWVEEQNKVTRSLLDHVPFREQLKKRLTGVYNYERYSCPFKRGSRYFFFKNDGLQNQSVLYIQESLEAKEAVLLDPNKLSSDGTVSLGAMAFSECGTKLAYGTQHSGSDWQIVHVLDVNQARDMTDKLEWVKFSSLAWTHDGKGFFYSRYPTPEAFASSSDESFKRGSETQSNKNQSLYYHRLGTAQSEDSLIYSSPENPTWMFGAEVTDDGKTLLARAVISIHHSTDEVNRLYYAHLGSFDGTAQSLEVVKLVDNFEANYEYICNEGSRFLFRTNNQAPRSKVIAIDIEHSETKNWEDVIPHSDDVLDSVICVNQNKLITCYLHHVQEIIKVFDTKGSLVKDKIDLPSAGSLAISGRTRDDEFFFKFMSFLFPGTIYRFSFVTQSLTVFREIRITGVNPSEFTTEQVFYKSKDGTRIPMYIVRKKSTSLNGQNPCLLYGYGGFNISLLPVFSVSNLIFIQHFDAVLAIPNLRGGGEYGETWHEAGKKAHKQNVFDDFHAAAEYLIEHDYTSSEKLIIYGGSNGGLLVAACANQRPELYGCAVAAVGVLDMLRFHKFTIGYAWCSDYGCSDEKEDFEYLVKYSPVHNVPSGTTFPALLLTTADHDDRVVPLHSYKYIATVQEKIGLGNPDQRKPVMILIDTKAGHGGGKPLSKIIDEHTDVFSFMATAVGAQWHE